MAKRIVNSQIKNLSAFFGLDLGYFIGGSFWLNGANIVIMIGGLFLSSLFSRVWPKDVYGQFSFLTFAFSFLTLTSLSGMTEAVFQGSIEKRYGVFTQAIKRIVLFSLFGSSALIIGSLYFFIRDNSNLGLAVFLAAFAFPFSSLAGVITAYYNGRGFFRTSSFISIGANLFSISLTAIALLVSGHFVIVALISTWSTAIFNIFLTILTFRRIENRKSDKKLLRLGMLMSLTSFIWLGLDYLDKLLIPLFLGFEQNAIYTFAILIPFQMQNFLKPLVTIGQTKISEVKEHDAKRVLFKKSLQFELVIVFIVASYIILCPFIFKVLYPDYKDAVLLSQIFALTLLYYPSNLFGSYLVKKRVFKRNFQASIINAFVSVSSLLLFLYLWGLIGAVISKVIVRIVQVLITQFVFWEEVEKKNSTFSPNNSL